MDLKEPLYIKDRVVKGFGRGSKELGCPTANVDNINHLTIPTGIYCGLAQLVINNSSQIQEEPGNNDAYTKTLQSLPFITPVIGMVCSFGYNPQYGNKDKTLEVHLLDRFEFNFYGSELRVLICKKMRDEEKYDSLDSLKAAIANDITLARRLTPSFSDLVNDPDKFLINNNNISTY